MNEILVEANILVRILLGSPDTSKVLMLVAVVALLILLLLVTKVGNLFDFPLSTMSRSLLLIAINGIAILGLTAAAKIFLTPKITDAALAGLLPLIVPILLLLILTAPMMMLLQKAKYVHAVICLALSIAGAGVAVALTYACVDAFSGGSMEMKRTQQSRDDLNDVMSH